MYHLFKKQTQIKVSKGGNNPFYFTPQEAVNWFDFSKLLNTFIRVKTSSTILDNIDKREVMDSYPPDTNHDYSMTNTDEFWLDYMADTGDGFNATTTVFYAITRPHLQIGTENTQRGRALVIGGDLVYPDASEQEYNNRFKGPIRLVFPNKTADPEPHLYANPGNHDWYDGLSAFSRMMLQKKSIGGYRTNQNRSYYALKITHNVYFLALDNQLKGDIDIPQVNFFINYVKNESLKFPEEKKHIILNIAEPCWYGYDIKDKGKRRQRFDSIDYFMNEMRKCDSTLSFDVLLAGDIHHYNHYKIAAVNGVHPENKYGVKHLITSGGGGAFKHMGTHLQNDIQLPIGSPNNSFTNTGNTYPNAEHSQKHNRNNLFFLFHNTAFAKIYFWVSIIGLFTFYLFSNYKGFTALSHQHSFCSFIVEAIKLAFVYPLIIVAGMLLPFYLSMIINSVKPTDIGKKDEQIFGITHGAIVVFSFLTQLTVLYLSIFLFDRFTLFGEGHISKQLDHFGNGAYIILVLIAFALFFAIVNSILQSTLYGFYLYINYRFFSLNTTEASSGKVEEGYNHFLRFKFTKDKITIYAIGIEKNIDWMREIKGKSEKEIEALQMNNANDTPRFSLNQCLLEKIEIVL